MQGIQEKYKSIKVKGTNSLPFCAVGIVQAIFKQVANLQATGTLITPSHVLTAASNIYSDKLEMKATYVYFYAENTDQNESKKHKIKVKKVTYSHKYLQSSIDDRRNYNMAILELQQNTFIKEWQFLKIHWNWKRSLIIQSFMISGYPEGKQQKNCETKNFVQYMQNGPLISIYHNWIKYSHQLSLGTTGSPLIIEQQGKYSIIGMHLGVIIGMRFGILLANNLQNSFTVLKNISKQYKQIQNTVFDLEQQNNHIKFQQRVLQLQEQVKTLQKQKQQMRLLLQNIKQNENEKFKEST